MRLVAWNCNMAMHRKLEVLLALRPDVAVLGECASTASPFVRTSPTHACADAAANTGWASFTSGFAFGDYRLPRFGGGAGARLSVPVVVQGEVPFRLLAMWTQGPGYIEEAHRAVEAHADFLASDAPLLVAGDLNSNKIFDAEHAPDNHSRLVHRLDALGLASAYHAHFGEAHGEETRPTYYHYRRVAMPFHLDYVFAPTAWRTRITSVAVGDGDDWLGWSDHMPLVVDVRS